jgi:hypothetical protein
MDEAAGDEYPGGDHVDHRHSCECGERYDQSVENHRQLELIRQVARNARDLARLVAAEDEAAIVDDALLDRALARHGEPGIKEERPPDLGEHRIVAAGTVLTPGSDNSGSRGLW